MGNGFGKAHSSGFAERDRKKLILLAGAVFVSCLVSVVVIAFRYQLNASATGVQTDSATKLTVLISEKPIMVGQKIADSPLKETLWPSGQIPETAIRNRADLIGLYASVDVAAGIPLLRSYLTESPPSQPLEVTPGNRAVTIEVDAISGIEGLALPGTRVDVVLTYSPQGELVSKIIVQNARVLSAGGRTKATGERDGSLGSSLPEKVRTVTLDVSTKDALSIQTATQLGRLSLIMRAAGYTEIEHVTEVRQDQIGGLVEEKKNQVKPSSPGCSKGFVKIDGQELQLDCGGSIFKVEQSDAP